MAQDVAELVVARAPVGQRVRELIVADGLADVSGRATIARLALTWGLGIAAAAVALAVDDLAVWILAWVVLTGAFVASMGITHEATHGHLFGAKWANTLLGVFASATVFGNYSMYRIYHLEHHAKTAQPGDPEGTPLNFTARWQLVGVFLLGGLAVLVEFTVYTVLIVIGRPPRWVRTARQRRAVRLNALVLVSVVAAAVVGMLVDPGVTLRVWLIPAGVAIAVVLPLLLLPEHYGATGEGDILHNTRTVRSNALVRWAFWNNNYHAAHHLAPVVPYDKIQEIDAVLDAEDLPSRWRVRSYTAFAWGSLTRLAFNRRPADLGPLG